MNNQAKILKKEKIIDTLGKFDKCTLPELESLNLLDRYDSKYIISDSKLIDIIDLLKEDYAVLNIDSNSIFQYSSLYFDTADYHFYNQHHNGKLNRIKIRNRHYIESDLQFLELKTKLNGLKTYKERHQFAGEINEIPLSETEFIANKTGFELNELIAKLKVNYERITLISKDNSEKVTIDRNLYFKNTIKDFYLDEIAVIEIKHSRMFNRSKLSAILKEQSQKPALRFSKYCIGLILTGCEVKYNRFKSIILEIDKQTGAFNGQYTF